MSPTWKDYVRLFSGSAAVVAVSTGLSLGQALTSLPIAMLLKRVFDGAASPFSIGQIALTAVLMAVLYMSGDAMLLAANHLNLKVTKTAVTRLRKRLIESLYLWPLSRTPADEAGRLQVALVHETERVDNMSNSLLSRVFPCLASAAGLLGVMVVFSWRLTLIAMLIVPATGAISQVLRGPLSRRIDRLHSVFEIFSADTLLVLQRRELARIHGGEAGEVARLIERSWELNEAGYSYAWLGSAAGILQGQAMMVGAMLILLAGAALIAAKALSVGVLIAFYFALGMLRSNLSMLFSQIPVVIAGHAALQRLFALLHAVHPRPYAGTRDHEFGGEITLERVSFGYRDAPVLESIDMRIRPSCVTAIGGPSGSGKTTIAKLILGLIRPDEGRVLADAAAYDDIKLSALLARIGFAGQDPVIFAGTVRDNLLFGAEGQAAHLQEVLDLAGASDFIAELPEGLDTWVGEGGALLSGGQRQRLSIARAALRNPTLLILDEPTNHLGARWTGVILERLRQRFPDAAMVIISHEPAILAAADFVYMCERGAVSLTAKSKTASAGLAS